MFLPILEPVVDRPFVRRNFGTSSEQKVSQAAAASALIEYNKSLFSLGVVLIELWFGQDIECLQHTTVDVLFNDNSIYQTAQQQIGELLAASENYGLAVSRCLSGLSRPMKTTDLNDRDFKNAVHEDIICLLEKNLEIYHDI